MGRKNRREREQYEPLDLTPVDVRRRPPRECRADRIERQVEARAKQGIDWSVCIVPGCGDSLVLYGRLEAAHSRPALRRADETLPVCYHHGAVIWETLARYYVNDPKFAEAIADVHDLRAARSAQRKADSKAAHLANTQDGDIYFVKVGELVKVGWTRDLAKRLKAYGASAEFLYSYPASRDDETNLHRQLRPALAKGREWYTDGDVIAHFINEARARFGDAGPPPVVWTEPKRIVAGKRATRRR